MANSIFKPVLAGILSIVLVGCGGGIGSGDGLFSRNSTGKSPDELGREALGRPTERETIWDLFGIQDDPNSTVEVNKYIWNASLDVLNFLPIQAADPFSGIIVTGYGTPPGGGRAYRATILIRDPALNARSLNLALQTRSGAVSRETVQAIEDAILTRARQLRVADSRL